MSEKKDPSERALVQSRSRGLTTRSSNLVQRGLKDLLSQRDRIVSFPQDRSIGKLYIKDLPFAHSWFADDWNRRVDPQYKSSDMPIEARGNIIVPSGKVVILKVEVNPSTDLSPLAALASSDLHELYLDTHVNDAELVNIKGLTGLRKLWLLGETISDAGLVHLQGLAKLQELTFLGTRVSDAGLAHLRTLRELKRLNLWSTQVNGFGLAHLGELTDLRVLDLSQRNLSMK